MDDKRQSQISEQQEILIKKLKSMDELSIALGERLTPIRCAVGRPTADDRKKEMVEQTLAPHADFLRSSAKLAESINARMVNILDELAC